MKPMGTKLWLSLVMVGWLLVLPTVGWCQHYKTTAATVSFSSDAPLETIKAQSNQLAAVVSPTTRVFAFSVQVSTFQGFNSALQRQHFNENYLQSDKYPYGTFKGKIIETVNLSQNGTYQVRAKGILDIHGVKKERIIPATVVVNGNQLTIRAQFDVPLVDHDIRIPKVVNQKIAELITITVTGNLGLN